MNLPKEQIEDITLALKFLLNETATQISKEFNLQGHKLSGSSIRQMEIKVTQSGNTVTGVILVAYYWSYLENGVTSARIPYSGRRGVAKVSKYIQGLISYFERRGLPEKEAKSAAFATAAVHRRQGMPTRASRRFSRAEGGARTGFIARAAERVESYAYEVFAEKMAGQLQLRIVQALSNQEEVIEIN